MKKSILIVFVVLSTALSLSSFRSASDVKVIVVVNKADWCSICKAYAGRTVTTFTEHNADNYFQFIVNDITNEETKRDSKQALTKVGLEKTLEGSLAAGVLSFYDVKTKRLLAQVTVANTTEEIVATMKMVREKASN